MRREFSKPIKRDAFLRARGECEGCGAKLGVAQFHFDHIIPDGLGGEPTLDNCAVLCRPCHKDKTTTKDVPTIAKAKRIQDRHIGIKTARQKIQSAGFRRVEPQRSASRPLQSMLSQQGNERMAFDFMTKVEGVPGKRDVKSGMAYFAGTGPNGSTCGKCAHYGWKEMEKKCVKYREMAHSWGANLKKTQSACKYFEAAALIGKD